MGEAAEFGLMLWDGKSRARSTSRQWPAPHAQRGAWLRRHRETIGNIRRDGRGRNEVVLVPRPRVNLVPYYGVLAPRAAWRAEVVPALTGHGPGLRATTLALIVAVVPLRRDNPWSMCRRQGGAGRAPARPADPVRQLMARCSVVRPG